MNKHSLLIIRQFVFLLLCANVVSNSFAIIIRHDVGPARYEVKSSSYPSVFFLEQQGDRKVCAATIIHQQWALTAAHCVEQTLLGNALANGRDFTVLVAGQDREIDAVIIHPEFDLQGANDVDLALLRFKWASATPRAMPLHLQELTSGSIVTLLGWGYFGLGTIGRQYSDGSLRLAMNRITDVDRRFRVRFDDPRDPSSDALPLEGMPSLGDSGGPALLESENGLFLVGITIGELTADDFSEETQGKYGAVAVYESVAMQLDWIASVIG
ncbi:MAG: trypsin-like serine protease, partial [Gammaproteobacteria bacterium]|nr:trypsin-like serine protease [Gammaproteobacteria bacterium]MBL4728706.1 trypsin-like serine protease [Gammaproteobacteria bacterium]